MGTAAAPKRGCLPSPRLSKNSPAGFLRPPLSRREAGLNADQRSDRFTSLEIAPRKFQPDSGRHPRAVHTTVTVTGIHSVSPFSSTRVRLARWCSFGGVGTQRAMHDIGQAFLTALAL